MKTVTINILKDFKFAYRGCDVVEYYKGETHEVTEECAQLALGEKWAKLATATKAAPAAPENKDAAAGTGAPENKDAAATSLPETKAAE